MLGAWFLPFCTLEMTGSIGGGEEQVVRDFSKTVWSWDLSVATVPVLLAPLVLFGVAWLGRRTSESIGLITLILLIALAANTYLAASIADRDWRKVPTPAAVAEPEPTPRCDLVAFPPAEFSCVLGPEEPMSELREEVTRAGYEESGLAGFRTGVGSHLFITISFVIALGSAWVLLRRRMSRFGAGLVIALGVALIYVVVFFDTVDDIR